VKLSEIKIKQPPKYKNHKSIVGFLPAWNS